ncbi:MAG: hypothetical protein ABIH27_02075 [Candidatus Omnitrophota bacterium]
MHIKEILLQSIDKVTNLKTASFLKELEKSQLSSENNIRLSQWERLKELLEFSYEKSEFYRHKFKQCGLAPDDIKCDDDFKKLPITTKSDIQKYISEIISEKKYFFIQSSGTTGKIPLKTYLNLITASKKFAIYLRHLYRFGWDFDTKIFYFLPNFYKAKVVDLENGIKQCVLTFMQNKIAHTFFTNREFLFYRDLNPSIDLKQLARYTRIINSFKNKILIGRIDFFNILAYSLKINNYKIVNPKAIINIGALLPEALAVRVSSFFECPVYNIYGSSEFGYIAGNCKKNKDLHINEETHYIEIVKNNNHRQEHNGFGNIIATDLLNHSMPLIRYESGDLGSIGSAGCEHHALRTLDLKGRVESCIDCSTKRLLTEKDICNLVFSDENILQFNLQFKKGEGVKIRIVSSGCAVKKELLIDKLSYAGLGRIRIKYEDSLAALFTDKFQYVNVI